MQNDENTQDVQLEQEVEQVVEETTTEETPKVDDSVKLSPAEYRHYLKWKTSQDKPAQPQKVSPQGVGIEEAVLLAQGVNEELIDELKLRAPKYGGSLIKAQNDPKYVAVKEKFEKDQKQKDASLPAARGSGAVKAKKDFNTPGLSRDEHRKMVIG